MQKESNIYEQLLQKGFTRRDIHSALHKYMRLKIEQNKKKHKPFALYQKPLAFSKESHFLKNLISAVVSFIKTQFAKKPKNPV